MSAKGCTELNSSSPIVAAVAVVVVVIIVVIQDCKRMKIIQ
jgi:hypothetical protein